MLMLMLMLMLSQQSATMRLQSISTYIHAWCDGDHDDGMMARCVCLRGAMEGGRSEDSKYGSALKLLTYTVLEDLRGSAAKEDGSYLPVY